MANRKEINVFSVSFLDLLSGALAAVIILFVIVPKATQEGQKASQTLDSLQVQTDSLATMIERARTAIPDSIYQQLKRQAEMIQATVDTLTDRVAVLEGQLANTQQENEQLRRELEEVRNQLSEIQQTQNQNQGRGPGEVIFGLNAEVGIVVTWKENVDVDLYLKKGDSLCFYGKKNTRFAQYMDDITSRSGDSDERYELIYQKEVIPGTYEIYIHPFGRPSGSNETIVKVKGYIVMYPGEPRSKKIEFSEIRLDFTNRVPKPPAGGVKVGVLTISENNISLQQ